MRWKMLPRHYEKFLKPWRIGVTDSFGLLETPKQSDFWRTLSDMRREDATHAVQRPCWTSTDIQELLPHFERSRIPNWYRMFYRRAPSGNLATVSEWGKMKPLWSHQEKVLSSCYVGMRFMVTNTKLDEEIRSHRKYARLIKPHSIPSKTRS